MGASVRFAPVRIAANSRPGTAIARSRRDEREQHKVEQGGGCQEDNTPGIWGERQRPASLAAGACRSRQGGRRRRAACTESGYRRRLVAIQWSFSRSRPRPERRKLARLRLPPALGREGSAIIEGMIPRELAAYADICGRTLARGHARSGNAVTISAYLGSSAAMDQAPADFAEPYPDRNELDYAALTTSVKTGRVKAQTGL
ncbi:MAG: DUF2252 family protein [Solirubrobacteraceae bacterium]